MAAEVQAQAVRHIGALSASLSEVSAKATRLERQLHEAQEVAKVRGLGSGGEGGSEQVWLCAGESEVAPAVRLKRQVY